MKNLVIFSLIFALFYSCVEEEQAPANKPNLLIGNWGHSKNIKDFTQDSSNLYLGFVGKNETYNICVSSTLVDKYPGIKSEVRASINVWGHHIKRRLDIEFHEVSLDRSNLENANEEKPVDILDKYYDLCPESTDLVLGIETYKTHANNVGLTTSYYYDTGVGEKRKITSHKRALFLNNTHEWVVLEEILNQQLTQEDILDILVNKKETVTTRGKRYLIISVLMHEFGHIWGLCDQYNNTQEANNCDPDFSTMDPQYHSIMGSASKTNKLYLTKDDIAGIQSIAARESFQDSSWPLYKKAEKKTVKKKELGNSDTKNKPIQKNPRYTAKLVDSYEIGDEKQVEIEFTCNKTCYYSAFKQYEGSDKFIKIGGHTIFSDRPIVDQKSYTLEGNVSRIKVEISGSKNSEALFILNEAI